MGGGDARFAPDLQASIAWAPGTPGSSATSRARRGRRPLLEPGAPESVDAEPPDGLPLSGLGAVVFAGGFRPDYESWVHCAGAFDELGFPVHEDCASTVVPGLHFAGVHFLAAEVVAPDRGGGAAIVAANIAGR